MLEQSTVPLGTVPVYEVVARHGNKDFAREKILDVIREQAEQGVDYMTVHAGLLRTHIPLALKRKLGIVSRGGALLAAWMEEHKKENPFFIEELREIRFPFARNADARVRETQIPSIISSASTHTFSKILRKTISP